MICDPQELITAARCFKCLTRGMQKPVQIMLLANLVGCITPTPSCLKATNPLPPNGATGITFNQSPPAPPNQVTLQWANDPNAIQLNVYIDGVFVGTSAGQQFYWDATGVLPVSQHTWRVDTVCASGTTIGDTWSFSLEGFYYTPNTETVSWTDTNGNFSGNLAFFYANADIPSTTTVSMIGTAITSVSGLGYLTALQNLNVNSCLSLLTISGGSLASLSGDFSCSGCTSLTTINLSNVTHFGQIEFDSCPALTSVNLSSLASVALSLQCPNDTSLTALSLPALTTVGGTFDASFCSAIGGVFSLPSLVSTGVDLNLNGLNSATDFHLPNLSTVGGSFIGMDSNQLTALSFPSLTSIANTLDFNNCLALVSLSAPSLSAYLATINMYGCTLLQSCNISALTELNSASCYNIGASGSNLSFQISPSCVIDGFSVYDFSGGGLNAASVELILRRSAASAINNLTLKLDGGNSAGLASLSAQGQADYATLSADVSNTITINP